VALLSVVTTLSSSTAWAQTLSEYVQTDDGVLLATDVYLPFGLGPWPVILQRTPYDKLDLADVCLGYVLAGYACVAQDTRGRYASTGQDSVFRSDGADGRTTLGWITQQWWCDGAVGAFGGSALGITEYLMAPGADESLRCIIAAVATPDLYAHAFLQGGALRTSLAEGWLEGQDALWFLDEARQHRLRDQWWASTNALDAAAQVQIVGLHFGGWYDIFLQGTLDAFVGFQNHGGDRARGRQHLVVGPWTHAGESGQLSYPTVMAAQAALLLLPFFNEQLKGEPTAASDWPAVRIFLMGAAGAPGAPGNEWLDFDDWPPPGYSLPLYLGDAGSLSPRGASTAGSAALLIDPADPVPTLGGANLFPEREVAGRAMGAGPYDQREIEQRADVLSFSTATLERPVTAIGRLRCTLWVASDTPDLDLAVRLTDVYPDGRSMLVTDGIQRARKRCGETSECLLVPGQPTEIVVDLWSTALVFNVGHRIRIDISGTNFPRFEVNPNHGGDIDGDLEPVVAQPTLLWGADYPSRLELPIPSTLRHARRHASDTLSSVTGEQTAVKLP